jgi:hypothetical protein
MEGHIIAEQGDAAFSRRRMLGGDGLAKYVLTADPVKQKWHPKSMLKAKESRKNGGW